VEFRVKSGTDLSGALETILDLHNKRFESKGKSTSLVGFDLKFLRSMIDQIPEKFDLVELHASGRPIASRLMLIDGRTCFGILTGFEPDFASYSPMRILLNESIRRSFEELNCQCYDMGPGYEAYKLEWDPSAAWNRFCCIGGLGPYAKIAGMAFRAVWSRSLPRSYGTVG
jgi:CelD/BcsL family acetyltransferase involved in cellulose biosynthesis